eukprot:scaffold21723_cov54-Phaeocystis_antarctica.AAC.1
MACIQSNFSRPLSAAISNRSGSCSGRDQQQVGLVLWLGLGLGFGLELGLGLGFGLAAVSSPRRPPTYYLNRIYLARAAHPPPVVGGSGRLLRVRVRVRVRVRGRIRVRARVKGGSGRRRRSAASWRSPPTAAPG